MTGPARLPIPVTLLSGFLGSGKTTLLKRILESPHGLKIAVIINDIASVNIDAKLIQTKDFRVSQQQEKVVQLENGCACCTLRSDLVGQLVSLAYEGKYQYILIEGSGLSEPMSIAQTFTEDYSRSLLQTYASQMEAIKSGEVDPKELFGDIESKEAYLIIHHVIRLGGIFRISKLDTAVTVIDGYNFLNNYDSFQLATTSEAKALEGEANNSSITDLLVQQIEFADTIIVNKISEIKDPESLRRIEEIIATLNPHAKVLKTNYAEVGLEDVLNTKRFNFDRLSKMSSWAKNVEDLQTYEKKLEDASQNHHEHVHKPEAKKRGHEHVHEHEHKHEHKHEHEHEHSHGHSHNHENCDCSHEDNHIAKYGINSFIYKAERPFHPGRLNRLLRDKFLLIKQEVDDVDDENDYDDTSSGEKRTKEDNSPSKRTKKDNFFLDHDFPKPSEQELINNKKSSIFANVIRLKGFLWLASNILTKCEVGGSGQIIKFQPSSEFLNQYTIPLMLRHMFAELPNTKSGFEKLLQDTGFEDGEVKSLTQNEFGDAATEVVFIGFNIDKAAIELELNKCLLDNMEWKYFRYTAANYLSLFKLELSATLEKIGKPKDWKKIDQSPEVEIDLLIVEDFLYDLFGDHYTPFI